MKKTIALCLALFLCVTALPAYAATTDPGPSLWALEEVSSAISMGFVPERLQSNYQQDITRDEFAELAVRFCAYQFDYALGMDRFLTDYRMGHVDANGNAVKAVPEIFVDATQYGTMASALGITNGKGGGKFDPYGSITRQEAATMLLRTYTAYSAHVPTETIGAERYTDSNVFPTWAADSIMRLKSWSVMKGDGNNTFHPAGRFTREQSILTFLRLDRYAPYSRSRGSMKPLVSVDALPEISQPPAQRLRQLPAVFDGLHVTGFDGAYVYAVTAAGQPCVYTLQGTQILMGDTGTFSQAGEGLFVLRNSAGVTYYTAQGTMLNHSPYVAGTDFYGGTAVVQKTAYGQMTIIGKTGGAEKTVSSQNSKITASSFAENCVRLTAADGTNFLLNIDTGAKTSPNYMDALPFSNGYAAVRSKEGGWGYIRRDFSEAIACRYGAAKSFGSMLAPVANQGLVYGAISSYKSQTVISFEYQDMTEFTPYGYALGQRENGQCVLLSVAAPPVSLPAGNIHTFQIYGKYVVQEVPSGYIVLNSTGTPIFPDMSIQGVYGCSNAGDILIESEHHFFYWQMNGVPVRERLEEK